MAGPDLVVRPCLPTHRAGVTGFVCVNCSATGQLSSRWLFLHRAGVACHISASKASFAADLGFKEIHVEAQPSDIMVGAGGWLVLSQTYVTNLQVQWYTIRYIL
jgi:hypothetical protein